MRRYAFLVLLLLLVGGFAACSSCLEAQKKSAKNVRFENGYASLDDLIQGYLEAIEKKDPQLLKQLFLTAEDFDKLQEGRSRQLWQSYFMICKRAFMDKNRVWLGLKLEKMVFTLGQPVGEPDLPFKLYRASSLQVKLPDGSMADSEINFIVEAGGTWKIFGLKYLSEEINRRGLAEELGGIFEGEAKFQGVDNVHDVQVKVKRVKPEESPAPAGEPTPSAPPAATEPPDE